MSVRTVVELDLVGFSDIARQLEENLNSKAVAELQAQIQVFIEAGLNCISAKRETALLKTTGDGAILTFDRPDDAHRFAAGVHACTRDHNTKRTLTSSKRWFRIGIATGDLYLDETTAGHDVAGIVIANAVRLETAAQPGEIVVDSSTFELLPPELQTLYGPEELVAGKRGERFSAHRCTVVPYNGASTLGSHETSQPTEHRSQGITQAALLPASGVATATGTRRSRGKLLWTSTVTAIALAAVVGWFLFHPRHVSALNEKDTIVLADIVNHTNDPVFQDTLKQALAVQLEESPFLNILSDRKVAGTLRLMGRSPDEPVTGEVAREVCQRTGATAMLAGSVAALGSEYVIGLDAINCNTGDTLAKEQTEARSKEDVLNALGKAARGMRRKLGESLSSVRKFATPIEEATTSSLEALKAYSQARKIGLSNGGAAGIPAMNRAVELDPKFALAYDGLAVSYMNRGEPALAAAAAKKAFELRDRVTDREKYRLEMFYYSIVTGQLERANQGLELWAQAYPRDPIPLANLGNNYMWMGEWKKAFPLAEKTFVQEPSLVAAVNDIGVNLALNKIQRAQIIAGEAEKRGFDAYLLHLAIFQISFLRNDQVLMQQQVDRSGEEDWLLSAQADAEAYYGRLAKFRDFSRRAVQSALRADAKETAALWQAEGALYEAAFGNTELATEDVTAALRLVPGKDVRELTALALAQSGEVAKAQKLAESLDKDFPQHTIIQGYWLPAIRAAVALKNRNASKALELLQSAAAYEFGQSQPLPFGLLYPVYLRGQAYLALRQGSEAAAEFQQIIDHKGITLYCPIGALAHVGLARAYALEGDPNRVRAAYQDFLTLWKGADPDVPILREAKVELARCQ